MHDFILCSECNENVLVGTSSISYRRSLCPACNDSSLLDENICPTCQGHPIIDYLNGKYGYCKDCAGSGTSDGYLAVLSSLTTKNLEIRKYL